MSAMVLATACAFDSGGVPGSGASGASIGSNDSSGTSGGAQDSADPTTASTSASTTSSPSTTATTDSDPDSGMTADPSTTASSTTPTNDTGDESTGPMVAETGDEDSQGSLDSAAPMDTGETLESTDAMTEESGVIPPDAPYYGNCDESSDCGDAGVCYTAGVYNGPDAHVCLVPCGVGCPPPETGVAMELCTNSGYCVLSCQQDEDCPDGMACYVFNWDQPDEYRRCLWSQG
jgi:hypothetical protein